MGLFPGFRILKLINCWLAFANEGMRFEENEGLVFVPRVCTTLVHSAPE